MDVSCAVNSISQYFVRFPLHTSHSTLFGSSDYTLLSVTKIFILDFNTEKNYKKIVLEYLNQR